MNEVAHSRERLGSAFDGRQIVNQRLDWMRKQSQASWEL